LYCSNSGTGKLFVVFAWSSTERISESMIEDVSF
jgi:hypothetical protein